MPFVNVKLVDAVFTTEEKHAWHKGILLYFIRMPIKNNRDELILKRGVAGLPQEIQPNRI